MIVDAHQHFWNPAQEPLLWMTAEHAAIERTFAPGDLRPLLDAARIDVTVLVQAACSDADTDAMFEHAEANAWIGAVTAWVDLESPSVAAARLDELAAQPALRGIRHLIQDEQDPHWILRPRVLESLALVEQRGLVLELPCVFPRHLGDVPVLAQRFPELAIVIDHLGKPPIGSDAMPHWEGELRATAAFANIFSKVSGLNTALTWSDWSAADLRAPVEVALDCFGAQRLLCGSDWPVALMNGDYGHVWGETVRVVEELAGGDAGLLLGDNAARLYGLGNGEWRR